MQDDVATPLTSGVSSNVRSTGIEDGGGLSVFIFLVGGFSSSESDDSVDSESEEEDGSGDSSGVGAFAVLGRLCSVAGTSVLVDS